MVETSPTGSYYDVNYGDCGTWNDDTNGEGFLMYDPYTSGSAFGWNELTYSSSPWQQVTIEYDQGSSSYFYDGSKAGGNGSSGSGSGTTSSTSSASSTRCTSAVGIC